VRKDHPDYIPAPDLGDLVEALDQKFEELGNAPVCPYCECDEWHVAGVINNSIVKEIGALYMGGPSVPTVGLICKRCSHFAQFSLHGLGLLE
jgi:hypothetical protein